MKCKKDCPCPKTECANHGKCCACVENHLKKDGLTHCMFPDNAGDKSLKNFYASLKNRFENEA